MNIAIVGTGYVGLVSGTCFSEMGVHVTCIDIDESKINKLQKGEIPIYEPGLKPLIEKNIKAKRLSFATDLASCLDDVEIVMIAVGTPPDEDGSADLRNVLAVARTIGRHLNNYVVVVTKSTVPVGAAKIVRQTIQEELDRRGVKIEFDVASNPEFLKEGTAIKDFMSPDRVVIGTDSHRAQNLMRRLYKPFMLTNDRIIYTDIASAEMIKYASNAMLATRISFMNDIANLCELLGANVNMVRKGIGSDPRIGNKFLYPGCGYGGSCFPKDVKALVKTAEQHGYEMRVIKAVEEVNKVQKEVLFNKLYQHYEGQLTNKIIALWGLSFKPETDDMREAPSLTIMELLLREGAIVKVYDPVAMDECYRRMKDAVIYCKDMYDVADGADAIVCLTEWKEFRIPKWKKIRQLLKGNVVLDGRNIYDKQEVTENGLVYYCIGS